MFAKGWGGFASAGAFLAAGNLGIVGSCFMASSTNIVRNCYKSTKTGAFGHNSSSLTSLPKTDLFARVKKTPKEILQHFNQAVLANTAFAEAVAQLDTDLE
jgi:hypothetical protein